MNVIKTQYCVFGPKNSNYEVKSSAKINNEAINQIGKYDKDESVKFLGIYCELEYDIMILIIYEVFYLLQKWPEIFSS